MTDTITFKEAEKIIGPLCDMEVTIEWVDDSIRKGILVGFSTSEKGSILVCARLPNSPYVHRLHPYRIQEIKTLFKN